MRNFDPWIGNQYEEGIFGVRTLVLGESHYGTPPIQPEFTSRVIASLGQKKRFRFFSMTQRLVSLDPKRGFIPTAERKAFWEKVAFANFVQEFVGNQPRKAPSPRQWIESVAPFMQTVEELKPQLIIVLGERLKQHLPPEINNVIYAYVKHPSGSGFSYKKFQPVVAEAFKRCASCDGAFINQL